MGCGSLIFCLHHRLRRSHTHIQLRSLIWTKVHTFYILWTYGPSRWKSRSTNLEINGGHINYHCQMCVEDFKVWLTCSTIRNLNELSLSYPSSCIDTEQRFHESFCSWKKKYLTESLNEKYLWRMKNKHIIAYTRNWIKWAQYVCACTEQTLSPWVCSHIINLI